ncbi:exonuclease domain-containing protein [Novispirillum sp. DQ9]|uniref:exonuclease domain-containing protein n=1 Tax=Novispirillum sp. DQ9 TaxID=3398612 RepID=UPI003C7D4CCE
MSGGSLARWFKALVGEDLVRWTLAARRRGTPLGEYYRRDTPTVDKPWTEVEFLAVDLETTGLDPAVDSIVSIGWVPIVRGGIVLSQARHALVRPSRQMPEHSAVLHGILDDRAQAAPDLAEVLPVFLMALRGRIPVAHHAVAERGFLDAACMALYDAPLVVPFVDTLALERRLLGRRAEGAEPGMLRLGACRERYGLPRYRAHNALVDALACGELMLAQAAHMTPRRTPPRDQRRMDAPRSLRLEQLLT